MGPRAVRPNGRFDLVPTPLMRPKRRPPRPKHPKLTHFHRSGLRFGRFPAQRRSIGGVGRHRRAWPRCQWVAAGPGRASRRRVELPNSDPAPQVWRTPKGPEGTATVPVGGGRARAGLEIDHSEPQARVWRSRGRAAAHGHTKQPGLTRQKILQPEVWQLVQRLNSAQDAQQLEPQQINEKHQPSHQHSHLHSNTRKSHMRNMRAS